MGLATTSVASHVLELSLRGEVDQVLEHRAGDRGHARIHQHRRASDSVMKRARALSSRSARFFRSSTPRMGLPEAAHSSAFSWVASLSTRS